MRECMHALGCSGELHAPAWPHEAHTREVQQALGCWSSVLFDHALPPCVPSRVDLCLSGSRALVLMCMACVCREAKQRREQAIEDRRNAVNARRAEKRAALPAEAPPGGEGCALIRVKLPQGASTQRRFPSGATVGDMYDWVDSLDEIEAHDYVLTSTFPRQEHPRADAGALLCDVGLVPNAALMVIVEDE